jgi:uncharacterized membrane protein (GlpM family)
MSDLTTVGVFALVAFNISVLAAWYFLLTTDSPRPNTQEVMCWITALVAVLVYFHV